MEINQKLAASTLTNEPFIVHKKPFLTKFKKTIKKDWQLYSFLFFPLLWVVIFKYIPMVGNIIAFRRFFPGGNIWGEEWVGIHFFNMFISDPIFWSVFQNTFLLGFFTLIWTFPMPIIFALLLNELKSRMFKKIVQTLSYLPHFLSIVVVIGLIQQMTALEGPINQIIVFFGGDRIPFMQQAEWFRTIFITSRIWQTTGWGTILYLAALTNIDPTLYEAAKVDGANRWQQTVHITLPGIAPTIITLLILNVGWVMGVNFEQVLLQQNPLVYSTGDVISTYLFRLGLTANQFSYATAIGLFESLIGITLLTITNFLSRKLTDSSLW